MPTMNTIGRIAAMAVVAWTSSMAEGHRLSASLGASMESGETASTRSGNASVAPTFGIGEDWELEPGLSWSTSQSSDLDTLAHSLVTSLDVRWEPLDHLALTASGWASALEDPLDEGGSLDVSTDWEVSDRTFLGGGGSAGWSQSAAWFGSVYGNAETKFWILRAGVSVEESYATVPVSTTGKSAKSMYAFQTSASGRLDANLGTVILGPSLTWSGYSYEKKMGRNSGAMGMSRTNVSGSHSEWNAGAHLSWFVTDWLSVEVWGGRRWTDDETSLDATTRMNRQGRLVVVEPLALADPTVDYAGSSCSLSW